MNQDNIVNEINELLDELLKVHNVGLSSILKKANRISKKVDFNKLQEFINNELNGYKTKLPDYRILKSKPVGIFHNQINGLRDKQPLIYEEYAKMMEVDVNELYNRHIDLSIPEIEDFEKNKRTKEILFSFTQQQLNHARTLLTSDEERGWYLQEAYFELPENSFRRIIDISANKLEEHLLELQSKIRISEKSKELFFENGSTFDALLSLSEKIKGSAKHIILIDGYVDETTLNILSTKKPNVTVQILTDKKSNTSSFSAFVTAFNSQYKNLEVRSSNSFHDRFLIIDEQYFHIGASLKDAGKKTFMMSIIETDFIKKNVMDKFKLEWENYSH